MKNIITKLLAWACVVLFIFVMASCNNSKPVLKFTALTPTIPHFPSKTDYYIAYDNGKVKKTSEFVEAKVTCYYFNNVSSLDDPNVLSIDDDNPNREKFIEIAHNILRFAGQTARTLYVLDGRYFYTTTSKVFEYFPIDNSVKEIVSFDKTINHIELYESQ